MLVVRTDRLPPGRIVFVRSPAWYVFGDRRKIRRHHGILSGTTAAARLVPQRRQNLRLGSFGSAQLEQMRSPGFATLLGSAWVAGRAVGATVSVGCLAAG
jgi:hypothetical protein